ncbi:MAG: universal stress protein [Gemmatimonadetes bacterium]|nr:universal stress protein [Gemmatimonadota bacterium]
MHFVVGVDTEEGDVTAFAWARVLARRVNATLEVVHVVEREPAEAKFQVFRHPRPRLLERIADERRRRVLERLAQLEGRVPDVPVVVVAGAARAELARRASVADDAVLVVGSGRRRWLGTLLGTTADRLLRIADVPVLVVRGPVADRFDRVLVAVDFSAASLSAAHEAARWAQALGGSLRLYHVPELRWERPLWGPGSERMGEDGGSAHGAARSAHRAARAGGAVARRGPAGDARAGGHGQLTRGHDCSAYLRV